MVKSLYSGVSGLTTHQQKMDVIGNNIANVNTTGFKAGVVTFADIYYQTKRNPSSATATLGGVNPRQVGYGVKMNSTTPNMTQSGFTYTDHVWDMALDGEGFFQLQDGAGNILYTRAGKFDVDDQGYLVNASGYHVLGTMGNSEGQPPSSDVIRIVVPETNAKASSATKKVNGVDITVSMSAPSDNSDMSVTFTNSTYPFATYANGILNIFMNFDEPHNSEADFQKAIQDAIKAGGVELPDDLDLQFEFGSIPDDTESKFATNTIDGDMWTYTTKNYSCEIYSDYKFKAKADSEEVDKYARVAFTSASATNKNVAFAYEADATETKVEWADGVWTITACPSTTADSINKAIKAFFEDPDNADTEAKEISCTTWVMPSADNDNLSRAIEAINTDAATAGVFRGGKGTVDVTIDATVAGAYANDYKITFAYSSTYGDPKAVWDENNLTITVTNDCTVEQIQEAINKAANGEAKRMLTISGMTQLDGMNPQMRKTFFEDNPYLSLGDGKDSFFDEVGKSLGTFNLTNGRTGEPQFKKDLEDITVQTDGTIIGYHPVHGYITLGRIDIAVFDNPSGLSAVGGTNFMETVASGPAKVCKGGEDGAGEVLSNALEMSNVDLALEFTDMITTQRGYQANSRVITTSDTMLEELLSLKR